MRIYRLVKTFLRHPVVGVLGAVEFRGVAGMTHPDHAKSAAYDAGRELAHLVTGRRWDCQ